MRGLVIGVFVGAVAVVGGGAWWLRGPSEPAPLSSQQLAAERRARKLLDGAVTAGTFRAREREEFRVQFRQLTGLQRARVAQRLSAALNTGKLHLDPREMPF